MLAIIPGLTRAAEELGPPPYLVSGSHHVLAGVTLDEAVVRSMLPPGVQPAAGITGGINMYTAERASGLPPYSSFWIWVDVEGFDAPDGSKGHWMLTGAYSPDSVASALHKYFGYPTRGGTTGIELSGDRVRATGTVAGKEMVRIDLARKPGPCQRVSSAVSEVTRDGGSGKLQTSTIPFMGEVCNAESFKVDFPAPAGDVLARLKPIKILWVVEYKNDAFGWSAPVAAK
jgi:hypothetical protein